MAIITTIDCNKYSGIVTSKGSLGFEHSPQTGSLFSDKIHNNKNNKCSSKAPRDRLTPRIITLSRKTKVITRTRVIYNIK